MQKCRHCGLDKPFDDFWPDGKGTGRYRLTCKACKAAEYAARIAAMSPDELEAFRRPRRAYNREKRTGVAPDQYAAMFDAQSGVCGACGKPETMLANNGKLSPLTADHCHATGEARGLLCRKCNMALGLVGDDLAGVAALYRYISKFENSRVPCQIDTRW